MQVVSRWTATGSPYRNDLQILMSSMINPDFYPMSEGRPVTGLGMYTFINLEESAGELRIVSPDPSVNPLIDFKFFESEFDLQRCREVIRIAAELGQHSAFADIIEERLQPSDEELASDDALNAFILSNVVRRPAPDQHLPRWARLPTPWPSLTSRAASTASRACAWPTPQ